MAEFFIRQLDNALDLPLPKYQTQFSAGMDLYANVNASVTIQPNEIVMIPTGIKISIPQYYEAQIRARSGLAAKNGITLINAVGTIDADYRGEITVPLINFGGKDFIVKRGDRIAQMVINEIKQIEWSVVQELDETTRGAGGFGHTGV